MDSDFELLDDVENEYLEYVQQFTKDKSKDGIRNRQGRYLTEGLFIETAKKFHLTNMDKRLPYTLKVYDATGEDFKGNKVIYKSLYKIFMNSVDEYQFAMRAFNSYYQYSQLLQLDWFFNGLRFKGFHGIKAWREEKEMKERSFNLRRIVTQADIGNVQSIKLLEDRFRDTKQKAKAKPDENMQQQHEEVSSELKKIKLRLIKNAEKDKAAAPSAKLA